MGKLGKVILFERNEKGTFDWVGETPVMPYGQALNLYAEIPNPASQLVEGTTLEEVVTKTEERIKDMTNKEWLDENLEPYL